MVRTAGEPHKHDGLVLIVDDDPKTCELVAAVLTREGHRAETAHTAELALERLGQGGVDVVLLDSMMPHMTGAEACRLLKGSAALDCVPIILMTVRTDASGRAEAVRAGADDHIAKPIEEAELIFRIGAMLQLRFAFLEARASKARYERLLHIDELTLAGTQRLLSSKLDEAFQRAEAQQEPLACCVFDIDRFALVNERAGRPVGDDVLRGIADSIRRCVREGDALFRYGGDEFVLLLPSTPFAGAIAVTERIWRDVGMMTWATEGGLRVTLSAGLALFPSRDVRTKEGLLLSAEVALSHAKRDGRNRICVFQQQGFVYTPAARSQAPPA